MKTKVSKPRAVKSGHDRRARNSDFSWQWEPPADLLAASAGANLAALAVDRPWPADIPALRFVRADGTCADFSAPQLSARSAGFANLLKSLRIGPGQVVAVFTDRCPALYIAALGTLKARAVFCPLFASFGPEPLYQRLARCRAAVLITDKRRYQEKAAGLRKRLPDLKTVLLTDADSDIDGRTLSLERALAGQSEVFTVPPTDPRDPALLFFTSGTTGLPKGALHTHDAARALWITGLKVLDLGPGDVYWCTADPGWVTGTMYGLLAPLLLGVTALVDEAEFDAQRWLAILQDQKVNVWYTSPSALRRMMHLATETIQRFDVKSLRMAFAVGEALTADVVAWGRKALGRRIRDTWWQTETGAIMIAQHPEVTPRPGAMGKPIPLVRAAVMHKGDDGQVAPVAEAGAVGELALQTPWPSLFTAYLDDEPLYRSRFVENWYLTGDLVREDPEGYLWFVGRCDDLIKTAGHMVGPVEVEAVLLVHPAVAEAAVVGIPDPLIGQAVKAFIVLKEGVWAGKGLELDVLAYARRRLGPALAPREAEFVKHLPRNRAGKILRRVLADPRAGTPDADADKRMTDDDPQPGAPVQTGRRRPYRRQ